QEPRLHMVGTQRLAQKRVVEQVDLTDREVIRGSPVRVDATQLVIGQRSERLGACLRRHVAPPSVASRPAPIRLRSLDARPRARAERWIVDAQGKCAREWLG